MTSNMPAVGSNFQNATTSEQQVIVEDWLPELSAKVIGTYAAGQRALRVPPGEKHRKMWQAYNTGCQNVVEFVNQRYGSVEALIDFMKHDLEKKANPYRISLESYLMWETTPHFMPNGQEAIGVVEMLKSVHDCYKETSHHIDRAIKSITDGQPKICGASPG